MALNIASLNVRGLRDSSKCARLLGELKKLCVDVAAVQETHFTCEADCRVLKNDFNVFSAYGSNFSAGVSLLVGRSLDADVDVVFAGDGGRLVVADVAVKSFKFRLVAVYAPNIVVERVSFFRRLAPFLDDTKRLVLMGDWNAILDPKIDKVGRGASSAGRCDSSLAGLMTRHDLVDRFRFDHPGREMWTWLESSPSAKVGTYLDRVLVRRADIDFVSCPTFHLIAWTDHKLVSVSLRLADRPRLAGYWKFNTSLLEIRDFRDRLESLIQRALVGAVTGNRWWGSLKHRIRDFATKYGQQLNLDKAKEAKSIEDRLSRAVAGGDSLNVELARGDLERESSERYKGYVVRSRLKRVLNEAVKTNATAREEEVRRFPDRYIASVKAPDGRLLRSSREIRDAFRAHFRGRFARCTDLPIREFRSYLADFPRLGAAEAAGCEGVVTECEVRDALKQVGLNKSPGLDGLPYEVYLRMSHMFVPILTDMFNHWFAQGAIPGSVTKGVITLLKKGGRHVWEGLDDYRPITLLNTELKILARVLANRLQRVISDLIGPEQTFAVKGRSIQDNLHLIREVLEGIEDDTEAALISLDQSKAFDRVDHRFLASVLETAGFKPEFRRWISMMYHNPQAVVQVNGRRSEVFAIERSVRQGCPLSPLLYVLALEPLLRRLRDEGTSPALRGIPFVSSLAARVSAFADDITVFVSRRLDIKAVKKAVSEYERIAGAKVNFDKSEGLRLGAWRGSDTLPGPFRWSDGPVRILGVWFGPDLQLERNWSEVQTKVNAQVATWLSRRLSLKGRAEACAVYVFPLILYRLAVLPLPKARRLALQQSLSRLLWRGARPMVRRQVCIQRTRNGGLGMPDLESHWLAERLAYLGRVLTGTAVWRLKASRTFPRLKSDPKAEGRRRPLGETLFVRECRTALRNLLGSSDLSWPRKELYRELVVGSASDPLSERHGWTMEEIRSHWNWAPGSSFLNNSEFSLTWRLARNALPLAGLNYKAGLADMPDCTRCGSGLEETAEHAFYYCERVRPFWDHVGEWTARIEPKQLVLLDVGYVVDNVLPPFQGEKRVVFLAILAVARMVVWTTRNKGFYDDANFSHRDLVLFFRHLLRVKIRCDRKCLDRIKFSKRWVNAASLVVRKGAMLESSFPPLPTHGVYGTGP